MFSISRLPSNETLIASPFPELSSKEEQVDFKKMLNAVKLKKNESDKDLNLFEQDLKEFLRKLSINIEDYKKAIRWEGISRKSDKSNKAKRL